MTLPPFIKIKIDCPRSDDLSGLLFQIRVTAGIKNPYYIYFPQTSADGTARLAAEDFRGQFTDHWEMGLMYYNGSVETAGDLVAVKLFDPHYMAKERRQLEHWPLLKHERTVWKTRQEMIDYFLSCRNLEFYFIEQSVRVPADGLIQLTVGRKIGATQDA